MTDLDRKRVSLILFPADGHLPILTRGNLADLP